MQNKQTTFKNLQILEEARTSLRLILKAKYKDAVEPFCKVIEMVAKANDIDHFEAAKKINDQPDFIDTTEKRMVLASALMEIVEERNLRI